MSNHQKDVKRPEVRDYDSAGELEDAESAYMDQQDRDIKALEDENVLLKNTLREIEDHLTVMLAAISGASEKPERLSVSICNAKEVPNVD